MPPMAKATAKPTSAPLTARDLGRATLARQRLLARDTATPAQMVERLAGMQAQLARPPYIGLWTRIAGFTREALHRALLDRTVVRGTMMRGTLHLASARDFRALRPSLQPGLDRAAKSILRERYTALDLPALVAEARAFLGKTPRTFDALRDHLLERHPGGDERAMAYAIRCTLPLVQVPTDGSDWGFPGSADFAVADRWLGAAIDGAPHPAELVRRYLAAFGPATAADAQTWSGVPNLKATFEALRPELVSLRDERGRELFDLPDAPRPGGDAAAPVRYLPDYDNLVLGHDDRSRLIDDAHRPAVITRNLMIPPTFLVDGRVAGTWKIERKRRLATLTLTPFASLAARVRGELEAEGEALLAFVEPDAGEHDVVVAGGKARAKR